MNRISRLPRLFKSNLTNNSSRRVLSLQANDQLACGWKVVNVSEVPELNLSHAVHLKHEHCNAQWLHMENLADETNAFSVHFKTVPQNSNGVAHILEHTTLCGSQKFPIRDPFFKMLNRSLATMNAMTGADYTFYPFATPNAKDFYNLMQVYLDAVFNPLLRETDFLQEGWRLDMEDKKGDLAIKGIVFNEMKGAFSDSQRILGQALLQKLLPSDTYGNCSGGLPINIPELTWEDLKSFHSVHYSPNNARFYTYGNLPLEKHLKAVESYLPPLSDINTRNVPNVPSEPKWSSPRKTHISCPADPSGASNTIAVSFMTCPIEERYETFVLRVIGDLLIDGPSAPFYKNLIESGLGSAFSPVSGYDSYTKDTAFTVGLQGIDMDKADDIEKVMLETLIEASEQGFEDDRIQAILNSIELSLKKQKDNFGWGLIMNLTHGWNHVSDPLTLLSVNPILDQFRNDIQDKSFLKNKVKEYLVENNHRLTLTMAPAEGYLEAEEKELQILENSLVENLTPEERTKAIDQGKLLNEMQSEKDTEDMLKCLPTLTINDIPMSLPKYDGINHIDIKNIKGMSSIQPTNEVVYFKLRLNTDVLDQTEQEILPLLSMVLTCMGAGDKTYREMDTLMELHTGGLGSSVHLAENPLNAQELNQEGLMLTSTCLEKSSEKMLSLWQNIFNGVFETSDKSMETTSAGLRDRLTNLIGESAVGATNGIAHMGHHYAMAHAASKLNLPALKKQEGLSGITMVRLLNTLAQDETKMENLLNQMTQMARKLLVASNIETFSLCATPKKSDEVLSQFEQFISNLPHNSTPKATTSASGLGTELGSSSTFLASPFPVHFCSAALMGAPGYTHPDAPPLRVLSRLLSSKYLHVEIREKGGAYGGGCSANPTGGNFSFFSYRDPNFDRTMDIFHNSNNWIQKENNFTQRDIDEAKLNVFKALDQPVLPSARGQRLFLCGITDEQFENHRNMLRNVSIEDVKRVSEQYLGSSREKAKETVLGPSSSANNSNFIVEELLNQ